MTPSATGPIQPSVSSVVHPSGQVGGLPPSHADLLACAVEAAQRAGRHAAANRSRRREAVKVAAHDVKLQLDIECQRIATDVVAGAFPRHEVLGEEDPQHVDGAGEGADYQWIIDPIDGTVNFSHGTPFWCCSVAVRSRGEVVAGTVFAPDLRELFAATADTPAVRNGEPISVTATDLLDVALVMSGTDHLAAAGFKPLAFLSALVGPCRRVRCMGSAALDMCRVAKGEADGYFEAGVYLWDVAAAALIVNRAGGRAEVVHRLNEPHRLCSLATNGRIHDELKRIVTGVIAAHGG